MADLFKNKLSTRVKVTDPSFKLNLGVQSPTVNDMYRNAAYRASQQLKSFKRPKAKSIFDPAIKAYGDIIRGEGIVKSYIQAFKDNINVASRLAVFPDMIADKISGKPSKSIGTRALDSLGIIGNSLDQAFGGAAVKSIIFGDKSDSIGKRVSKAYGLDGKGSRISSPETGNFFSDLALEIALDPATWVTFGASAAAKQSAKNSGNVLKAMGKTTVDDIAESTLKTVDDTFTDTTKAFFKDMPDTTADQITKAISKNNTDQLIKIRNDEFVRRYGSNVTDPLTVAIHNQAWDDLVRETSSLIKPTILQKLSRGEDLLTKGLIRTSPLGRVGDVYRLAKAKPLRKLSSASTKAAKDSIRLKHIETVDNAMYRELRDHGITEDSTEGIIKRIEHSQRTSDLIDVNPLKQSLKETKKLLEDIAEEHLSGAQIRELDMIRDFERFDRLHEVFKNNDDYYRIFSNIKRAQAPGATGIRAKNWLRNNKFSQQQLDDVIKATRLLDANDMVFLRSLGFDTPKKVVKTKVDTGVSVQKILEDLEELDKVFHRQSSRNLNEVLLELAQEYPEVIDIVEDLYRKKIPLSDVLKTTDDLLNIILDNNLDDVVDPDSLFKAMVDYVDELEEMSHANLPPSEFIKVRKSLLDSIDNELDVVDEFEKYIEPTVTNSKDVFNKGLTFALNNSDRSELVESIRTSFANLQLSDFNELQKELVKHPAVKELNFNELADLLDDLKTRAQSESANNIGRIVSTEDYAKELGYNVDSMSQLVKDGHVIDASNRIINSEFNSYIDNILKSDEFSDEFIDDFTKKKFVKSLRGGAVELTEAPVYHADTTTAHTIKGLLEDLSNATRFGEAQAILNDLRFYAFNYDDELGEISEKFIDVAGDPLISVDTFEEIENQLLQESSVQKLLGTPNYVHLKYNSNFVSDMIVDNYTKTVSNSDPIKIFNGDTKAFKEGSAQNLAAKFFKLSLDQGYKPVVKLKGMLDQLDESAQFLKKLDQLFTGKAGKDRRHKFVRYLQDRLSYSGINNPRQVKRLMEDIRIDPNFDLSGSITTNTGKSILDITEEFILEGMDKARKGGYRYLGIPVADKLQVDSFSIQLNDIIESIEVRPLDEIESLSKSAGEAAQDLTTKAEGKLGIDDRLTRNIDDPESALELYAANIKGFRRQLRDIIDIAKTDIRDSLRTVLKDAKDFNNSGLVMARENFQNVHKLGGVDLINNNSMYSIKNSDNLKRLSKTKTTAYDVLGKKFKELPASARRFIEFDPNPAVLHNFQDVYYNWADKVEDLLGTKLKNTDFDSFMDKLGLYNKQTLFTNNMEYYVNVFEENLIDKLTITQRIEMDELINTLADGAEVSHQADLIKNVKAALGKLWLDEGFKGNTKRYTQEDLFKEIGDSTRWQAAQVNSMFNKAPNETIKFFNENSKEFSLGFMSTSKKGKPMIQKISPNEYFKLSDTDDIFVMDNWTINKLNSEFNPIELHPAADWYRRNVNKRLKFLMIANPAWVMRNFFDVKTKNIADLSIEDKINYFKVQGQTKKMLREFDNLRADYREQILGRKASSSIESNDIDFMISQTAAEKYTPNEEFLKLRDSIREDERLFKELQRTNNNYKLELDGVRETTLSDDRLKSLIDDGNTKLEALSDKLEIDNEIFESMRETNIRNENEFNKIKETKLKELKKDLKKAQRSPKESAFLRESTGKSISFTDYIDSRADLTADQKSIFKEYNTFEQSGAGTSIADTYFKKGLTGELEEISQHTHQPADLAKRSVLNRLVAAPLDITKHIERTNRASRWMFDQVYGGLSARDALNKSLTRHFDYSSKSAAEMYMEILVPFLTFPMRNMLYWSEAMEQASTSRFVTDIMSAQFGPEAFEGGEMNEEGFDYSSYIRLNGYTPINEDITNLLGFDDPRYLKAGSSQGSAFELASNPANIAKSLTPIISSPRRVISGESSILDAIPNSVINKAGKVLQGRTSQKNVPDLFTAPRYDFTRSGAPVNRYDIYDRLYNSKNTLRNSSFLKSDGTQRWRYIQSKVKYR